MKFNTTKKEILKALLEVSKVVPTRTTLPILSCSLFEAKNGELTIKATDLEQTIVVKTQANIIEEGSLAAPINKLIEIITALKETEVEFETKETEIEINSDNGIYKITGRDYLEYPELPKLTIDQTISFTNKEFLNIINNTTYAVSKDDLKPALCGVYLNIENNKTTAVATDGHRLVKYETKKEGTQEKPLSTIVPAKFFNIIKSSLSDEGEIKINISENHIDITENKTYFLSRIIKETFPDFNSVIPENNPVEVLVESNKILESIKRVSIFSNKTTKQIQLHFNNNEITVSTEDKESNSSGKEYVECLHEGEEIITRYNGQYLKEAISHLSTNKIKIYLSSAQTAAVFKPEKENPKQTALLMPLRANTDV